MNAAVMSKQRPANDVYLQDLANALWANLKKEGIQN
jgi:hypothetical protein